MPICQISHKFMHKYFLIYVNYIFAYVHIRIYQAI